MKTCRRVTQKMTKLMADLWEKRQETPLARGQAPVHVLVDLAAGVHEGQVVLVHEVFQHEIHQAWEDGGEVGSWRTRSYSHNDVFPYQRV